MMFHITITFLMKLFCCVQIILNRSFLLGFLQHFQNWRQTGICFGKSGSDEGQTFELMTKYNSPLSIDMSLRLRLKLEQRLLIFDIDASKIMACSHVFTGSKVITSSTRLSKLFRVDNSHNHFLNNSVYIICIIYNYSNVKLWYSSFIIH